MDNRKLMTFIASSGNGRRYFALPACALVLLGTAACTTTTTEPVNPATPTLISVTGGGVFHNPSNVNSFTFNPPTYNATSTSAVHYASSVVRFSVPYPTSIELAINGKPLTKQDPPITTNYEYSGAIDNPGGNPATWSVAIKTPFDAPFYRKYPTFDVAYTLTIVNVSGSKRSAPLTINYLQPWFIPPTVITGSTTSHSSDTPSSTTGRPGPCPGGAAEQPFRICFRNPPQLPNDITVNACSYAQAIGQLTHAYGTNYTQGAC